MNLKEKSDSESDESPKKSKTDKKSNTKGDDHGPYVFSALTESTKKWKSTFKEDNQPPGSIVQSNLRRVEKEFVPVLEKTSAFKTGSLREDKNSNLKEESECDSDESPQKSRRDKKNNTEDDHHGPDTFSALFGSTKKRKNTFKEDKQDPVVIVKPKSKKVEKTKTNAAKNSALKTGRFREDEKMNLKEESDSESDDSPQKLRRDKKNYTVGDHGPDIFSALAGSIKKRKSIFKENKQDPVVIIKPKLKFEKTKMNTVKNSAEESDSQSDESPKKSKRDKRDNTEDDGHGPDIFSALAGSTEKQKGAFKEDKQDPASIVTPNLRRVEKELVVVLEKLSFDELMKKETYQRFIKTVDLVVQSTNDHDTTEIGEDGIVQGEYLLSRVIIQSLAAETAKLKTLGATEMIPTDKLVRVLSIMELNIRRGDNVSPITDENNESTMERVMGAAEASLVSLYIMTSPSMPKRVYLEDVIDRVVLFIKYQLYNTILPYFDCTYRLDNKKKDGKRKKTAQISEESIAVLYNKITELINLLAELLNIQGLPDTSIFHASSIGVSPFFVENVKELQIACLKLVTTIFTRYEKHRRLLLDDILASVARLPSTKRSLHTYRLNSEEHIQMLTALVLQLIQSVVVLPENLANDRKVDKDVLICNKYEKATTTAAAFLAMFLSKCGSKSEDIDYRPLFDNFLQDLLSTVNKPEWPAAELLLTLLGKMLVVNFSNKDTDMSLRVASLDYLGVVAARLKRDGIPPHGKTNTIDQMIKDITSKEMKDNDKDFSPKKKQVEADSEEERIGFLQRVLLDFLAVDAQNNEALRHARHFYIAQWYQDVTNQKTQLADGERTKQTSSCKDNHQKHKNIKAVKKTVTQEKNAEKHCYVEARKKFLVGKIQPFKETLSVRNRVQVFQTYIDYNSAQLIAQYLAPKRNFSQSFDQYLKAILIVLKETSIPIRTKALKCLTTIVEADPSVLGRNDVQIGVDYSFLDQAASVREAAVDLIGKLSRPELISKYYEMLSARILDTGVSVRKRVIKIFKDICIECPDSPEIPEICVKMIRRINDEEGIRQLVMEVFQNMWFTPTKDALLLRKVMNITDVVAASDDIDLEWFEQLLINLFKPMEDKNDSTKIQTEPPKTLLLSCKQIVDCLIENVGETYNDSSRSPQQRVACFTTLYLFAKIRPQLLVEHASTLLPYLSLKCQSNGDIQIISNIARMLELVVPLIKDRSDTFLVQLEEDLMKLTLQHVRSIIASGLSCLGSVVNNATRNFKIIRDCFKKYYDFLAQIKLWLSSDVTTHNALANVKHRQYFRRALFIVGLLLRHFDFKDEEVIGELPKNIKDQVLELFSFFLQQDDHDIQANTLQAVGSICIRHYEFMLEIGLKSFYHKILTSEDAPLTMKSDVLINIEKYLLEEDRRMIQQDLEWSKHSKQESLKEMEDISSGMASTIIQHYLKEILQSYLHPNLQVRQPALRVIQLILQQGLVHPVQIVPYLICMSTDCEKIISHSADKQLLELEKKYPGFIFTKSSLGIRLSYQLQKILQEVAIVRGFGIKDQGEYPFSRNGYLYSILRNSRQQRRALILNILRQFDEQVHSSLLYMLYLADNLAYFPYMVQDEPLFIIHHIDMMISFSGTNLLQSFIEGLIMNEVQHQMVETTEGEVSVNQVSALDEDDDDKATLVARVPEDTSHLQSCLTAAQGCLLLLMLKQHLKDTYGLSDSKIQQYSPSEAVKVYEKAASRRSSAHFNPKGTINKLEEGSPPEYLDEDGRKDLINQYLDFKQLMLKFDLDDPEDKENANTTTTIPGVSITAASTPVLMEAGQVTLANYKGNPTPKVPKRAISNRRLDTDSRRTPRDRRATEKTKKHRPKKKIRKFVSSSSEESENDYSDPDFVA